MTDPKLKETEPAREERNHDPSEAVESYDEPVKMPKAEQKEQLKEAPSKKPNKPDLKITKPPLNNKMRNSSPYSSGMKSAKLPKSG